MKDVGNKFNTMRIAMAQGRVVTKSETIRLIKQGEVPKGNVLEVARTAAILAAKRTSDILPYCHQIPLDYVALNYELLDNMIIIKAQVKAIWKTGVEMEALIAVSIAALTIYDMLKPIDDSLLIEEILLVEKKGGKSNYSEKLMQPIRAGIIVLSDSTAQGIRKDISGKLIETCLKNYNIDIAVYKILPDDKELLIKELIYLCDEKKLNLILTTGGTGFTSRDITPEATDEVLDRIAPGIAEAIRSYGQQRTPYAMLSRNISGIRGKTLIVNLPGSPKGVEESLNMLFPAILHAQRMLWENGHNENI